MKTTFKFSLIVLLFMLWHSAAGATPDPNFYIFLCFGQSNMEGNAKIEAEDLTAVPNDGSRRRP